MSQAHAISCLAKIQSDTHFAQLLKGSSKEENASHAEQAGFFFTSEEWRQAVAKNSEFKSYYRAGCTFPNECK